MPDIYASPGIAFFERLGENDSGDMECVVGSTYPGGLRRTAPPGDVVTEYDRAHFRLYVELLDALAARTDRDEMCRTILDIDPARDPDGAYEALQSHLDRAVWMSKAGFRQI